MIGLSKESGKIALMIFANSREDAEAAYGRVTRLLGDEDDGVLNLDDKKRERLKRTYRVGDAELEAAGGAEALGRLIVERGALLSLRR